MNVKKMWGLSVLLVVLSIVTFTGCSDAVEAKELIVTNNSSVSLSGVEISQYVGAKSMLFENILAEGETIEPGESKSFYIAPATTSYGTTVQIEFGDSPTYEDFSFTYDYEVNGKNEAVTLTFDGTDFSVSGSGAAERI
jgi:hypothetical protein